MSWEAAKRETKVTIIPVSPMFASSEKSLSAYLFSSAENLLRSHRYATTNRRRSMTRETTSVTAAIASVARYSSWLFRNMHPSRVYFSSHEQCDALEEES